MVKIGVFIEAIQVAVAQGAISAEVGAEAIKYYAEVGEFFLRRNLFDEVLSSDQALLDFMKRFQEVSFAIDDVALSLGRGVTDTASVSDSVSKGPNKARTEAIGTTDSEVLTFGKAVTEMLGTVESFQRVQGKTRTDTASVADTTTKALTKARTESLASVDVASKQTSKQRTDAAAVSDSGLVSWQNYAGDYFAEDYVGSSKTF